MGPSTVASSEQELIAAARGGDEQAFQKLVASHRNVLHAHCYRMLGSLHDADDALQDALIGAWQGLASFEGRSAFRTWLFTIATNASLRLGARRKTRVLTVDSPMTDPRAELAPPLEENVWLEPYPDEQMGIPDGLASPEARYEERESVELAFVAALQHLPATQRAVIILRDVLGFSAEETAAALDTSVASANSALQRARTAMEERLPGPTQKATRSALGDGLQDLLDRFVGAWARADVDALVSMLAADATFSMPPLPAWFRGREIIGAFFRYRVFALEWRFSLAQASGQPAIAAYQWNAESGTYRFDVLNVLSLRGAEVVGIHSFISPEVRQRFGLPEELPA